MSFIERSVEMWTSTCGDAYNLLFSSPQQWNPQLWQMVQNINATMTIIAASLFVLFFLYGIIKQSVNIKEVMDPAFWFKPILHFVIGEFLLVQIMSIMLWIFEFCQGLMAKIGGGGAAFNASVPQEIVKALDEASFGQSLIQGILGLLLMLLCLFMSILLIITVWGRFLKMYIYSALAPLFVAAAAGEGTSDVSRKFVRSWINVCLQGVVIMLALIIYTKLIGSDSTKAIELVQNGEVISGIMYWTKDFAVGGLITLGICKSADHVISMMTGL